MAAGLPALRSREGAVALGLAVLAALRVALFSAAFPFFSNVDEHRHIDAVLKYARGYWPAPGTDAYESEMPVLLGIYGSPEYHQRGTPASDPVGPPPWRGSPAHTIEMIEYNERFLDGRPNLEAYQPPVYYALAGAWLAVGRLFGLEGGQQLYWVRALNALGMFGLVLSVWSFLRAVLPSDAFVRLGVASLLVVFPQDCLYYVTPDSLSPWLGAAGWFGAFVIARRPDSSAAVYAVAGLAAAAAFLAKYTNAVVLLLFAGATGLALVRRERPPRLARLALLWALAGIPIALWLIHNQLVFGEWLASGAKLERLGWGRNVFAAYFDHPIFSPSGLWIFVTELLETFWRGELAWYRRTLASVWADAFYVGSSLLFVTLAAFGAWRRRDDDARFVETSGCVFLLGAAGVLVGLSLTFVFGERTNPTAHNPYLSQGRLVACALVPFTFLYVRGIGIAAHWLPERVRVAGAWSLLAIVIAVVLLSEGSLSLPVFRSEYNWFHYP